MFIINVFAHSIVSCKISNHMNTDIMMVILKHASVDRSRPKDVIHHGDIRS